MTSPEEAVSSSGLGWAIFVLIVALNLVLLAALLVLQKTVVRRVVKLDALAHAFGESGHRMDIPDDRSGDEIGRLTETFRTMSDRIARHTLELEQQVAERTEKLEVMARTDFLTGVLNRRGMMVRLESEHNRLARAGKAMGLLLVDLDHFKPINDTYGHMAGDRALAAVAGSLSKAVRDYDLVARWGGEEFLIALFDLDAPDELQRVADKLLAVLRDEPVDCGPATLHLTASIGGVFADSRASLDTIIQQADTALYRAKNAGRNQAAFVTLTAENNAQRAVSGQPDDPTGNPEGSPV